MKTTTVKNYSPAVKTKYTETNDLFPRCMHPDERTNKEFLRDLENKLFKRQYEEKQKRMYRNGRIMCVQTGVEYESAADAEYRLKLPRGHVATKLRGTFKHARGNSFIYI